MVWQQANSTAALAPESVDQSTCTPVTSELGETGGKARGSAPPTSISFTCPAAGQLPPYPLGHVSAVPYCLPRPMNASASPTCAARAQPHVPLPLQPQPQPQPTTTATRPPQPLTALAGVYTVKCLRGCLLGNFHNPSYTPSASSCVAAAQQYDYSSLDVVALFQTGARASTPPPAPTSSDASPSPLSPPPPSPGGAVNTNPSPSAGAVMPTGPCDGPRPPRMMGPGGDGPGGMGRGGMGPGGMPDPCMARPMSMPADGQPNGMPTMRDMPDGMPMAGGRPDDMPTMMRHDEPPHAAMPPAPKHSGHQHHKKSPPKPKTKKRPPPVRRVRKPPSPKRQHRKQGGGKL